MTTHVSVANFADMRPMLRMKPAALVLAVLTFSPMGLRAQVTEVPQTMKPGHALVRVNAISLGVAENTAAPNQYKALGLGTVLVAAGLTDSVDLEVGTQLYSRATFTKAGVDETHSGVGSVTLQPKWTFWKDPATGEAAAVIPYVILPSHSNAVGSNAVQGGIIVPWAMTLPTGVRAGAMFEWDQLRNASNTRYDTRLYASGFLKYELGDVFSAYAESTLTESTAGSTSLIGSMGGGATLRVSKNFEWDFEVSKMVGPGRNAWTQVIRFRWHLF